MADVVTRGGSAESLLSNAPAASAGTIYGDWLSDDEEEAYGGGAEGSGPGETPEAEDSWEEEFADDEEIYGPVAEESDEYQGGDEDNGDSACYPESEEEVDYGYGIESGDDESYGEQTNSGGDPTWMDGNLGAGGAGGASAGYEGGEEGNGPGQETEEELEEYEYPEDQCEPESAFDHAVCQGEYQRAVGLAVAANAFNPEAVKSVFYDPGLSVAGQCRGEMGEAQTVAIGWIGISSGFGYAVSTVGHEFRHAEQRWDTDWYDLDEEMKPAEREFLAYAWEALDSQVNDEFARWSAAGYAVNFHYPNLRPKLKTKYRDRYNACVAVRSKYPENKPPPRNDGNCTQPTDLSSE